MARGSHKDPAQRRSLVRVGSGADQPRGVLVGQEPGNSGAPGLYLRFPPHLGQLVGCPVRERRRQEPPQGGTCRRFVLEGDLANFRRSKPRRQVRCVLCTPNRWRGNSQGRFSEKEEAERRRTDPGNVAVATGPKSPKRNWSRNKRIRSLRARLAHLRPKQATLTERRAAPGRWLAWMLLDCYDEEIEACERELTELGG